MQLIVERNVASAACCLYGFLLSGKLRRNAGEARLPPERARGEPRALAATLIGVSRKTLGGVVARHNRPTGLVEDRCSYSDLRGGDSPGVQAMKPGKNSARIRLKLIRTAALLVWVVLLSLLPSFGRAQQSTAPKRVLVLYWYGKDFPGNVRFDRSFQAALQAAPAGTVEYYPEYLETDRFPGENQSLLLHDYLRRKYADRTIDVVVATADESLDFLLKYRNDLFPHTPIVFSAAKRPTAEQLAAGPGLTGIIILQTLTEKPSIWH